MGALITIIVPAYNVEKYIQECLNSLVHQTMINHKIVIVNDGSTDGTEKICKEFEKEYKELITYVYQENQGLGAARNTGMKYVDTPFLTFLDSDDWLNTRYVERFAEMIENTDEMPDMVFTLPWVYDSSSKCVLPWKDKNLYDKIFEVKGDISRVVTNARKMPEMYALEVTSCRKIYKTTFLKANSFQFPVGLKWEDVPGHFILLHQANTCMALPEVGFFYRINQGGQITSGGGKSRLDILPIFKQLLQIQKEYQFNEIEKAYVMRVIVDFSMWSVDVTNQQYIGELLDNLHELYNKFSQKEVLYYLKNISVDGHRESGFIKCLGSGEYKKLLDYETREQAIEKYALNISAYAGKGKNKRGLIRGGIQCICDHGVSYTLVWMCRKYLFGQR